MYYFFLQSLLLLLFFFSFFFFPLLLVMFQVVVFVQVKILPFALAYLQLQFFVAIKPILNNQPRLSKKDLTNFLVAEIIQCTKPLAKKKKLNAQVITRSEARKLVTRCEVVGGPGLSFQRIYEACTQRNGRTTKPKSHKPKTKNTSTKARSIHTIISLLHAQTLATDSTHRSKVPKNSGDDAKVNVAQVVEAAATSYLRHFGDQTSMQHLKAQVCCCSCSLRVRRHHPCAPKQLMAEFGEPAYRANEQLVIKLLARSIESWSSTQRLAPASVASAFFSCVPMSRCLDWAERLHGLRARLKPYMHRVVDTFSPSKSRDTICSAEVLADCVLRSLAAARQYQDSSERL